MPIRNNEFVQLTEEEIVALLETELRNQFGVDVDLSDSSVFSTIAAYQAAVTAQVHEADLKEVFDSGRFRTATGDALDDEVAILGINRRESIQSTTVLTFSRTEPANKTYNIQSGTIVQTDSDTPVRFETSASDAITMYEDFESGSIGSYTGDTAEFGISQTNPFQGSNELEVSTSVADKVLINTDKTTKIGDTLSCRINVAANGYSGMIFGVQDTSNFYGAIIEPPNSRLELIKVVGGVSSFLDSDEGVGNINADTWHEVVVDWGLPDINGDVTITVSIYSEDGTKILDISAVDNTWSSGGYGFYSEGYKAYWDNYTSYATSINANAIVGGTTGNVSANTITDMPIVPSGVEQVTNVHPAGNVLYEDIDDNSFVIGQDRENDEELRERVQSSIGGAGSGTIQAIEAALDDTSLGIISYVVIENDDSVADGDGRPAHSFEAVVFGGTDDDVAQRIFDVKAGTSNSVGGYAGTSTSGTATSSVTGEDKTITFSRPNEVAVDITMTLVTTENYVGDDAIRDAITEYIGGTLSDGTYTTGLDAGENVVIDKIKDVVVGEDTGVKGISSFSTTPATGTDSDGLEVIVVSGSGTYEVATTSSQDGSISITT